MNTNNQKILITAFDFPPQKGGVSTYALELAEQLTQDGYEVMVVARQSKQAEIHHSFKIKRLKLPSSGILSLPQMTWGLRKIIQTFQPHQILCTLWMPGGAAAYMALQSQSLKIPYTVIVHGMEIIDSTETLKKRLRSFLFLLKKQVFQNAQKVISISQYTKDKILNQNLCSPEKIHVVHNGVNPNKFCWIQDGQSHPEKAFPQLLTVARLVPHKGIDQVLFALPPVLREFPHLQYYIVGQGPDLSRLQDIVNELDLQQNVRFLGAVNDEDLPLLYGQSDLFILLSREEKHQVEGFGLVFLEAAACQTPSLGGRSGGIPDAIIEGKTGWLVDPTEQQDIVEKLLSLLQQPQLLKSIGESAYQHTLHHRTWDKVVQQIMHPNEATH